MAQRPVYVFGTFDAKGTELAAAQIRAADAIARTIDVSTTANGAASDVTSEMVADYHAEGETRVLGFSAI